MNKAKIVKVSDLLKQIIKDEKIDAPDDAKIKAELSLNDLTKLFQDRGFGLLMILCSFPMAIPLPYPPGFTTILGLPLMFFSSQMLLGYKNPKLPGWIGKKKFKLKTMRDSINKVMPYILKVENYIKPRFTKFTDARTEKLIGFISLICAIFITLPIPMGNAAPSAGILVMFLGLINKDGLTIIIGILVSIIGIIIATIVGIAVFLFTTKVIFKSIMHWLF